MTERTTEERLKAYQQLAGRIRSHAVRMTNRGKSGHVGSALSMADIVSVLYEGILRVDPQHPEWADRDRFLLSKGHAASGIYAALAEKGFFPQEWLQTYYRDNGKLSGHISHYVPGVEFSTGSLGHALPVAVGMALAARHANKSHRIFVLVGEGDCNEGSTWEAIMYAAQQKLDNLIVIVDYNRVQSLGKMEEILELEPFAGKLEAFGWAVAGCDGHDCLDLEQTLRRLPIQPGKPSWILARTIKGKGVDFMENTVSCHYTYVQDELLEQIVKTFEVTA